MSKIKRIDVFGAITLVSAIALILLGVSLGGNQYPWSDPIVYGTLIGGFADLGLFVLVEKYVAREPVMPLGVIFTRTPGFVALSNFFISMSQFAILYSIPLCVFDGCGLSHAAATSPLSSARRRRTLACT